jgi:hypothetical protein
MGWRSGVVGRLVLGKVIYQTIKSLAQMISGRSLQGCCHFRDGQNLDSMMLLIYETLAASAVQFGGEW